MNTNSPLVKMQIAAEIGIAEDIAALEAYKNGARPDVEAWSDVSVLIGLKFSPLTIRYLRYIVNFQVCF